MKVRVVKEFVDKHTGELHTVGSSFDCDKERFNEILDAGKFVEVLPDIKTEIKTKKEV